MRFPFRPRGGQTDSTTQQPAQYQVPHGAQAALDHDNEQALPDYRASDINPDKSTLTLDSAPTYQVKPGDNLSKIAAENGVSLQALEQANAQTLGGNFNLIRPGQHLVIPGAVTGTAATTVPSGASAYQIQHGDTLSAIAQRNNTTVAALVEANKDSIKDPNMIVAGQEIKISHSGAATAVVATGVDHTPASVTIKAAKADGSWDPAHGNNPVAIDHRNDGVPHAAQAVMQNEHAPVPQSSVPHGAAAADIHERDMTGVPVESEAATPHGAVMDTAQTAPKSDVPHAAMAAGVHDRDMSGAPKDHAPATPHSAMLDDRNMTGAPLSGDPKTPHGAVLDMAAPATDSPKVPHGAVLDTAAPAPKSNVPHGAFAASVHDRDMSGAPKDHAPVTPHGAVLNDRDMSGAPTAHTVHTPHAAIAAAKADGTWHPAHHNNPVAVAHSTPHAAQAALAHDHAAVPATHPTPHAAVAAATHDTPKAAPAPAHAAATQKSATPHGAAAEGATKKSTVAPPAPTMSAHQLHMAHLAHIGASPSQSSKYHTGVPPSSSYGVTNKSSSSTHGAVVSDLPNKSKDYHPGGGGYADARKPAQLSGGTIAAAPSKATSTGVSNKLARM